MPVVRFLAIIKIKHALAILYNSVHPYYRLRIDAYTLGKFHIKCKSINQSG